MEIINKLSPILHSFHWSLSLYKDQFLVGKRVSGVPQLEKLNHE